MAQVLLNLLILPRLKDGQKYMTLKRKIMIRGLSFIDYGSAFGGTLTRNHPEEPMKKKSILVVDDEKNIRLTMAQSLEALDIPVHTAVNGEEALQKLRKGPFGLVFLDLKMPGMDGMEVLRHIKDEWPKIRVIIITAHGTIESAVEAMKLGAVDFVQKPFSAGEIRELAKLVLDRETLDERHAVDCRSLIELTKRHISDRSFAVARETVRKAIGADPTQPESYNLLGVLLEIKGDELEAQKFYRAALEIDSTFKPARENLERITSWGKFGKIDLGPDKNMALKDESDKERRDEYSGHEK